MIFGISESTANALYNWGYSLAICSMVIGLFGAAAGMVGSLARDKYADDRAKSLKEQIDEQSSDLIKAKKQLSVRGIDFQILPDFHKMLEASPKVPIRVATVGDRLETTKLATLLQMSLHWAKWELPEPFPIQSDTMPLSEIDINIPGKASQNVLDSANAIAEALTFAGLDNRIESGRVNDGEIVITVGPKHAMR